jgi:hypothetical protein
MNWLALIFLGILGTISFIIITELGIGLRLTRMNIPFIVGTLFTLNKFRALIYGFLCHFLMGVILAFIYYWIMLTFGWISIWFGAILAIIQAALFMTAGCTLLPACLPLMADELYGPEAGKLIEPPGFLGMNYGYYTPLVLLLSHVTFGICVGLMVYFVT